MSYNGSGTFVINSTGNPVVTGTTISSTWANALTADLATGLSTALTKDGQTTPTANIPMGTFKITGLGNGTVATDAAAFGQLSAFGVPGYTATATAATTTTLTVASTQLQYFTGVTTQIVALPVTSTLVLGFSFTIVNNSTGVVTVNSSGGNAVVAMVPLSQVTVTCILTSGTSAASWNIEYTGKTAVTGTGSAVLQTAAAVGGTWTASSAWTLPAFTLGGAVTATGQTITGGTYAGITLSGTTTLVSGSFALDGASVYNLQTTRMGQTNPNRVLLNVSTNPTGTTSGTLRMMGLGGTLAITPRGTGRIRVTITGFTTLATLSTFGQFRVVYGTGTAPSNGDAASGTNMSNGSINFGDDAAVGGAGNLYSPADYIAEATGLSVGTAYWVDVQLLAGDGTHIASISIRNAIVEEM